MGIERDFGEVVELLDASFDFQSALTQKHCTGKQRASVHHL